MSDLQDRLIESIRQKSQKNEMLSELVSESEISRSSWGNMLSLRQRPTPQMIEFICKKYPEMAFWICTGYLPPIGLNHTSATKLKKEKDWDGFDFEKIVGKEPIEWSNDEAEFVSARSWSHASKVGLDSITINTLIEARNSEQLIEDYLRQRAEQLFQYARNEADIAAEAIEKGQSEELIRGTRTAYWKVIDHAMNQLEDFYDKKIRK
jgi:hypothetical protein